MLMLIIQQILSNKFQQISLSLNMYPTTKKSGWHERKDGAAKHNVGSFWPYHDVGCRSMKLHRNQYLLTCQLGSWVLEHAYQRDDHKARLQRVAPACAGTSHSSQTAAFSGSGSSRSLKVCLKCRLRVTVPHLKIGCNWIMSSAFCQFVVLHQERS